MGMRVGEAEAQAWEPVDIGHGRAGFQSRPGDRPGNMPSYVSQPWAPGL